MLGLFFLMSCSGDRLTELNLTHIRFNTNQTTDFGDRLMAVVLRWEKIEPDGQFKRSQCPLVRDASVRIGDVVIASPDLGGYDMDRGECTNTVRLTLSRADAPTDRGDKSLTIEKGTERIEVPLLQPFRPRNLIPLSATEPISPGGVFTFALEEGEPRNFNGIQAFLGPVGGHGDRVEATAVSADGLIEVHIPDDIEPGSWRLFVRGGLDVVESCPVQQCNVDGPVRATWLITVL